MDRYTFNLKDLYNVMDKMDNVVVMKKSLSFIFPQVLVDEIGIDKTRILLKWMYGIETSFEFDAFGKQYIFRELE